MAWLAISRMFNSEANKVGITTNIGFVLLHIDDKNGTPATKIAPLMGMEPRSLTRILSKMEIDGLIYRQADAHDGRVVRVFPTEEGLRVKAISKNVVINFNRDVYGHISDEKLATFFDVLESIHHVIKNRSQHDS